MTAREQAARFCSAMACDWAAGVNGMPLISDKRISRAAARLFSRAIHVANVIEATCIGERDPYGPDKWSPVERWAFAEALIRNGEVA